MWTQWSRKKEGRDRASASERVKFYASNQVSVELVPADSLRFPGENDTEYDAVRTIFNDAIE